MRQRSDLPFGMSEYQERVGALRSRMQSRELDAMLVTTPENICYLTGFDSAGHFAFQALVVPLSGEPFAFTRLLEASGIEATTWVEHNPTYRDSDDAIIELAKALAAFGLGSSRIGLERDCWFFTAAQQSKLLSACADATFVDASGTVEEGRLIKSEAEITLMKEAARTAEAGLAAGIDAVTHGATENDVAAEIHYAMIKAGGHWPALAPFVASGERGAVGHATWKDRTLRQGDAVFLEVGGSRHRYHAALLRPAHLGEPQQRTRRAFEVVQKAFEAATSAIRPGVPAGEIDRVARDIIAASDFGGAQASRTAYSMGLALSPDWGEGHILSMKPGEMRPLAANMTFHLLPWVQIPGQGGIGCSETIRVTKSGCELLTRFPRELFVKE